MNERIELSRSADGHWAWTYVGDGVRLRSNHVYADQAEARRSAGTAYPRVAIEVAEVEELSQSAGARGAQTRPGTVASIAAAVAVGVAWARRRAGRARHNPRMGR